MADNVSSSSSSGIGFFGLLTIALIVLKLVGVINLSWWWIALIFFTPVLIFLIIITAFLFLSGVVSFGALLTAVGIDYFENRKLKKLRERQRLARRDNPLTLDFSKEPIDVKSRKL